MADRPADVDVLVIGAGACGLVAAITAHATERQRGRECWASLYATVLVT